MNTEHTNQSRQAANAAFEQWWQRHGLEDPMDDEDRYYITASSWARRGYLAAMQAQQAEPVAWKLFKQALFVGMECDCLHYLMANAHGRRDGALKAKNHEDLCRHIVAAVRGCNPDMVRRHHEDDYQAVHDGTQALTDYLDEVIGFPLWSRPDYDDLTPKFFDKFFELAMAALGVSPASQPPAQPQAECGSCDGFDSGCDECSGLGKDGHLAALRQLANVAHRVAHAMGLPAGFDVTTLPDVVVQRLAAQPPAVAVAVPEWGGAKTFHEGRALYEEKMISANGCKGDWRKFGDIERYEQAHWVAKAAMLAAAPQGASCLPAEMTPAMMRAVQMRSELGAYAAANLSGAYDLFADFWRVAVEEAQKGVA